MVRTVIAGLVASVVFSSCAAPRMGSRYLVSMDDASGLGAAAPVFVSGVRIGTPSVTTQGMKEPEMVAIAELIARALRDRGNPAELAAVREDVAVLCGKFTPYAA